MRIFLCIGTRPEAIKMLPLALELRKREGCEITICHSGQHKKMADEVFDFFGMTPDHIFEGIRHGMSLGELSTVLLDYFDMLFSREKPDLVLVHGDTTTAFCAALAAFYKGVRIGHIEAGLRTFEHRSPFPEELNRVAIDAMSDYLFAPTYNAARNLEKEGRKHVFTVGNTVIDALRYTVCSGYKGELLKEVGERRIVILTSHRRENLGDRMRSALMGVSDVLKSDEGLFCIFPMHPNPAVREVVENVFCDIKNIKICEPLPIFDFHNLLSRAHAVITDSGGIQEEAAYLGVPVFLLRDNTERNEAVQSGNVHPVGTDRLRVAEEILKVLSDRSRLENMRNPTDLYGNGHASERIADLILNVK